MYRTHFIKFLLAFLVLIPSLSHAAVGARQGMVAETMDAAGYTYIKLQEDEIWIATSQIPVKVGDKIEFIGGMNMTQFHSSALDRSFDTIIFVANVTVLGDEQPAVTDPHAGMAPNLTEPVAPLENGMTIADVMDNADSLVDKKIRLRARVVKATPNIMGKNWITLVDGSRTGTQLIATSSQMAEPGQVVIAYGTLKKDIDLGYGYHYDVLLEETSLE